LCEPIVGLLAATIQKVSFFDIRMMEHPLKLFAGLFVSLNVENDLKNSLAVIAPRDIALKSCYLLPE
jgi:hypothetical protein